MKNDPYLPPDDAVYFLPLGGAGEIGMNLNLYGHAGKWLMVDLGISFPDETLPGFEILTPDPRFIVERREDLLGLVLTHAHEDHLGAVQYLWPDLQCPVYASPFTAAVLRAKLQERGLAGQVPVHEIPVGGDFTIGPFRVRMVAMTHSVPEPSTLAIGTPVGTIVHTGDWKLDPEPVIGGPADAAALRGLGEQGVMALLCDSTNAMVPGTSGSETEVQKTLVGLFGRYPARVAVTCFATNVARLKSIAVAAEAAGRDVALVGRSLWRIVEAARETGYLGDLRPFLTAHEAGFVPRDRVVLICTGSQGEPRSALARIAAGDHPEIGLEPGDVVIYSSREIPGNERAIGRVQNQLAKAGIDLVTADDAAVHVSGHPARDELAQMYQWVKPRLVIPVHGEERHLVENARLAESCQVPATLIARNGTVVRIAADGGTVVGHVPSGRLGLSGKQLVATDGGVARSRQRLANNGVAVVTLVIDRTSRLAGRPKVTVLGLVNDAEEIAFDVADAVSDAFGAMDAADRLGDETVTERVRIAVRRAFNARYGKKPVIEVHIVRL